MDSINMIPGNRVGSTANCFFLTVEEAAYPTILCQRFASICLNEAKCRGLSPCQSLQQQLMVDPSVGKRNLFAAQSRGNKLKQVLAECREIKTAISVGYQHIERLLQEFPKGTNVIHRQLHWGFTRNEWRRKLNALASPIEEEAHFEVLTLGVPRDPSDFIKDAHGIGHPRRTFARVPGLMREVLEEVFLAVRLQRENTSHRRLLDLWGKFGLWHVGEAEGRRHRLAETIRRWTKKNEGGRHR